MGKYLIRNEGCDDTTETEMDLSEYEYRVLEKFAVENNKNSHCGCQPRIEIYSNYKKEDEYYEYDYKDNLIPRKE